MNTTAREVEQKPAETEEKANTWRKKIGYATHFMRGLGVVPDPKFGPAPVHLVTTRMAVKLSGLSTQQLREWTIRRALIPADVKPKGHGSPAQYAWQSILLLRLALILRDRFKMELHAHRGLLVDLRRSLGQMAFRSLWGKSLAVHDGDRWSLLEPEDLAATKDDYILLRLDPHLERLVEPFSLAHPMAPQQYQLFAGAGLGLRVVAAAGGR
jgi:hypothetical protein